MRLGQLSRKVSVRPQEIVEFLASKGVIIEEGTNTRIEDLDALTVIQRFAPHLYETESIQNEISPETFDQEDIEPVEVIDAINDDPMPDETAVQDSVVENLEEQKSEEAAEQELMLIKAQKVELKGLRILGKIELPEPKKKESPVVEEKPTHQEPDGKNTIRESGRNFEKKFPRKPSRNPVVLERERKAKEIEEQKLKKLEAEKERRKQYYANRVTPVMPVKSMKMVDEPLGTLSDEAPEPPKGFIRKFIHWLTTY